MITGSQIRAARAALRISAVELASMAGVGMQTIKRFEAVDGVPPSRSATLLNIQSTLESAGIEFIGSPEDAPGIRLHRKSD
jgi:DNA-binding transcriptional regulator YiaG